MHGEGQRDECANLAAGRDSPVAWAHSMKSCVLLGWVVMGFSVPFQVTDARTYTFLREAIREQVNHPGPEAEAKLRVARRNAWLFDRLFDVVPAMLVGALLLGAIVRKRRGVRSG